MKYSLLALLIGCLLSGMVYSQEREYSFKKDTVKFTREMLPPKYVPDTRIDNMGYWKKMAEAGLVPVAPNALAPPPIWKTTKIMAKGVAAGNSPDVQVTSSNSTQSENSVFISPDNGALILNSNNSTPQPSTGSIYGADYLFSVDTASTWQGSFQGAGGGNSGDPTTCINDNGRWFVGFINNGSGQSVAYSDNQGTTWTVKVVANAPSGFGNMLDKNHMWIDNSPTSPYNGNLYNAWTTFGGANENEIGTSRSTDDGNTWSGVQHISSAVNAGSHNQGVNMKTGPNGEVYAVWAIYDSWPSDENALAMAKSLDGGATWQPAYRIINNIKGIRNHNVTQNMRVNSFPSMAVDISDGENRGNIYVVWTNVNTPGVNTGQGVEVYLIKSEDEGVTWSTPVKVNSDPLGTGKQHYLPWVCTDPSNGNVAVIFYDNRNVASAQAEAWCAVSVDGAETFEDFAVSDVAFTPSPIPNMASSYMGDYLAIGADKGVVYPVWTDTRLGYAMTFASPFLLTPAMNQAYITYQNHAINDFTAGNHNGTPDFGENLLLSLAVKNIGDKPDTNVMVTLSCDSPLVTFSDSTENYGNFTIGEIKTISDAFAFHISETIANGTELVFNVKAVNNLDSANYSFFTMNAFAPELTIGNINVYDPEGNNNQVLDPGETANIVIHYTNNSLFDALNPASNLNTDQTFVTILNPVVSLPSIGPGSSDSAEFQVLVSDIPFGSAAQFHNLINYTFQSSQKSFVESIGLIVEDWETGTFTKFPWTFGGNSTWTLDNVNKFEGVYSAKSDAITHNQSVSFSIDYDVMFDDTLSFYRKVSTELFHDVLSFYVDGTRIGQWSGNQNWKRMAFPVMAGPHTFKWEYLKDAAGSSGSDAAWVDFIVFPPERKTVSFAGTIQNICENQLAQMNATAMNYQSLLWTTDGSGTFNDATILNPVYTPSASDIESGIVILTLTVTGMSSGETSVSSMVLTISPKPTSFAGTDVTICEGSAFNIAGASATNYSSLEWMSNGDGTFNNPLDLLTEYNPGTADITAGMVELYLVAEPGNECEAAKDTLLLNISQQPAALVSMAETVCKGDSTQLSLTLTGQAPFQVTLSSGEILSIPVETWQMWVKPTSNTSFGVSSITDANGCIGMGTNTVNVQVLPSPVMNLAADTNICANLIMNLNPNALGAVSYLWSPGGQTTASINVDSTGFGLGAHNFTVQATGSNGCKSTLTSAVTFRDCTGLDEIVGNVRFTIFPNPGDGLFEIRFQSELRETIQVNIFNSEGKNIYQASNLQLNGNLSKQINLKNEAEGTYILSLENRDYQVSKKLIIVR
ncbi:MAG: T9SS type A sorting domain-containing protein [Bacteroidales bacterium]|nr:T9SS type A sorting domain-containing protein [Bacteroidales bacterium]